MGSVRELDIVAIVGSDEGARELARLAARAGCAVRLYDPDPYRLKQARLALREAIEGELRRGEVTPDERQRAFDGLLATSDLEEALTHAELVLVPDPGPLGSKPALLGHLTAACRASAVVALGDWDHPLPPFPHPGRLVGLRVPGGFRATFPVEITVSRSTAPHALARACAFAHRLGRVPRVSSSALHDAYDAA